MCTSISFKTKNHYFGRTLDLELSYNESVVITAREFPLIFRHHKAIDKHFAIIGMATVSNGLPLYYDATNEVGLSMAGLNFPNKAVYHCYDDEKNNICPFELIPWILSTCETVSEVRKLLENVNIINEDFSHQYKNTPLHWIVSDKTESITLECVQEGIKIYYNPIGILTNCPDFPTQMFNLNNYMSLSADEPTTSFSNSLEFSKYSRGMGALGLPGDNSSMSRFVRVAFTKLNSVCGENEEDSITQFFNILSTVNQVQGTVRVNGKYVKTVYTSCCNTDKVIYYYKTYNNSQINAVNIHNEDLDTNRLIIYKLEDKQQIKLIN